MNKIKHIIWDWNGTLVDDGWLFTELINQVLKKRDLKEISLEDYRQTFCFPLEKYYKRLGFNFNVEPYDVPSMEFVHLYNKNKYRPHLYKKAMLLLEKMKERGIKNYLLSAQNHSSLLELANFYNVSGLFETISGTDNLHARGKSSLANKLTNNMLNNLFIIINRLISFVSIIITSANCLYANKNRRKYCPKLI